MYNLNYWAERLTATFPWWEDLHGWWKNNPQFNDTASTVDLGQDFAAATISKLSQGKKDSCIVGDGWTSSPGTQDDVGEGDSGMAKEDDKGMVLDEDGEDGEGRWDNSQEPGEIMEEYGMKPGHSGAGTMDVPSGPLAVIVFGWILC